MPGIYQIVRLQLVFTTAQHGYSLTTLYYNSQEYVESAKGMLFILKSTTGAIFGGFCNKLFAMSEVFFIGNDDCFAFTIKPNREIFRSAKANASYLLCDKQFFSFGAGGDGAAIRVDESFGSCTSFESETFKNKVLTGKETDFKTEELEVYALI